MATFISNGEPITSPSPQYDLPIVCNNGAIKFGKPITLDSTRYYAYISATDLWSYSNDSYAIIIPVEVGQKYKITADPTTSIGGKQNVILRWGFIDNLPPETWKQSTSTAPSPSNITIYDWVRTTPQDTQTVEITATHPYLVIQMAAGVFANNITNGRILLTEQSIYTDGTVETATDNLGNVATAEMLLGVGDYKDTQEVISGAVTRNVGIKILDGTEYWLKIGNYNAYYTSIADMLYCNPVQAGLSNQFIGSAESTANMPNNSIKLTYTTAQDGAILFKHNDTTTLEDWVQFVTDKYNSGNPIIAIYPLATATTETVTGQFLSKSPVTYSGSITGLTGTVVESSHTTPTPTQPLPINTNNGVLKVNNQGQVYTDGTVETVEVIGKNLFDPTKVLFGYYRNATIGDKRQNAANFMSSDDGYIPCLPNTTYTFVGTNKTNGTYSKYNTIYFFDSAKNYLGASPYEVSQPTTGTTPNNCYYLQVRSNPLDNSSVSIQDAFSQFNWQLELGSTATEYEPYTLLGTATAEMLLKVGTYQDVQSVLDGEVTRKVGIKVLDGTENWTKGTLSLNYYYGGDTTLDSNTENELICNQFSVGTRNVPSIGKICVRNARNGFLITPNDQTLDTATKFKQWLADQYAKGTPVVIVYPISSPTTETVTAQPLTIQAGTNNVTITQASMDNLELEVSYKAGVEVTITEIENAQLDNSVEVTIA